MLKRSAQIARKVFFWFALTLLVLVTLAALLVAPNDATPFMQSDHFYAMQEELDALSLQGSRGDAWYAGWALSEFEPHRPLNLVGQKRRGPYQFIHDTPQIRALTLANGEHRVAWLSYEVLFVSPLLAKRIRSAVEAAQLPLDHLVFTATHTHSGMGGFADQHLGQLVFGKLDEELVDQLVESSVALLQQAWESESQVTLSFRRLMTEDLVENRLVANDPVDPFLRQLIFQRSDGTRATLITFSAHPTILSHSFMGLSGDYPRALLNRLEAESYQFALFAPSTPGSHRPKAEGEEPGQVELYAEQLAALLRDNVNPPRPLSTPSILSATLPLPIRTPHIRISSNWRLHPWIYRFLNGESAPFFDVLLLDQLLFISTSAEVSGVFVSEWESLAQSQGLSLMLSAFNGEYMGYITPDRYYNSLKNRDEVGVMNWFGPENGAYFDWIIRELIDRLSSEARKEGSEI